MILRIACPVAVTVDDNPKQGERRKRKEPKPRLMTGLFTSCWLFACDSPPTHGRFNSVPVKLGMYHFGMLDIQNGDPRLQAQGMDLGARRKGFPENSHDCFRVIIS